MQSRRKVIKMLLYAGAGITALSGALWRGIRPVFAGSKKDILPKSTKMQDLIHKNPARLDNRNLPITPLEEFDTMGTTSVDVKLEDWRLELKGAVKKPLSLQYADVEKLATIEQASLLICPGFFVYNGLFEGISVGSLLKEAGMSSAVTRVTFSGPNGAFQKRESFRIQEVMADRVFLAHKVNGVPLPQKHGFPLRVVALDHYGSDWLKYVDTITVEES